MPPNLLDDVKNYLDITWNDFDTDQKIKGIIARGMKYIDRLTGKEHDYTQEDKARELLLEYCFYVRNQALSEFASDFQSELLQLQMRTDVERWRDNNENDEEEATNV